MDIGGWLRNLGFQRYEPVFIENAIDSDVLPELTKDDLEKLGIPLGDRKRLIKAITAMLADARSAFITSARRPRDAHRGARNPARAGREGHGRGRGRGLHHRARRRDREHGGDGG